MSKSNAHRANPPIWVAQNFLTSTKTIQRLILKTNLCNSDRVIEIGPGKGHITRALARRCASVLAIELDPKLSDGLRAKLSDAPNVQLIQRNFLQWNLPSRGSYKVFSNIPFSITTGIVRRLTECPNPPADAWLLMEKGAARRFSGMPHESLRSLMLKPGFELRIVDHLDRNDFHPRPSVDVVMLHLHRKPVPDIPHAQMASYERFVRAALSSGFTGLFSKAQLNSALQRAGVDHQAQTAEMLYVQWLCLFRCFTGR